MKCFNIMDAVGPAPLSKLDRVKHDAQRTANRDKKACAVYNLNIIGAPLYVIRSAPTGEKPYNHLATFEPEPAFIGTYRMEGDD